MIQGDPGDEHDVELELDPVFEWRLQQLQDAGFTRFPAFRLAMSSADYHDCISMLENGATEAQVLDQYLDIY